MDYIQNTPIALYFLSALLGLLIGSFISMLSWRLPRLMDQSASQQLKSVSASRSECPHCQTTLPWYRLFPLFSWLVSKGKCHACQHPISARYPIIEAFTMLLTLASVWQFGLSYTTLYALTLVYFLITITVIDLEHYLILDKLSLPLMWIGLLINSFDVFTTSTLAIWGAALGYGLLWIVFQSFKLVTGKEGMGYGDFKLLAALGAWFGVEALAQIILIAALSSILFAVVLSLLRLRELNQPIPFGPYLSLAGVITLFFGSNLVQQLPI